MFAAGWFMYPTFTPDLNSAVEISSQHTPVNVHQNKPVTKKNGHTENKNLDAYYKAIVDNSIFRPLGWRPPKKEPEYTLIGTISNTEGDYVEAIIVERRSNQLRTVKLGETIGKVTVKQIKPKHVILDEKGKETKLSLRTAPFIR